MYCRIFFKSIAKQTHKDYILYLVDNSPNSVSDKIIEECLAESQITQYRHIKNSDNFGVAEGNNIGIRQALQDNCSYILLLNNDIELEQDIVFSTMLSLCEKQGEKIIIPKENKIDVKNEKLNITFFIFSISSNLP